MDEQIIDDLFNQVAKQSGFEIQVDLPAQHILLPDGKTLSFEIDPFKKHCLINGLDDIGLTLQRTEEIREYEQKRQQQAPWLFPETAMNK